MTAPKLFVVYDVPTHLCYDSVTLLICRDETLADVYSRGMARIREQPLTQKKGSQGCEYGSAASEAGIRVEAW